MEEKRFVLYEYLLYFWKKKIFFLIVTLITAVLVIGTVYTLKQDKKYTGVLTVFTGGVNLKGLTDPDNIQANYKEIKSLDVFVSEKGQVKFTVNGNSEAQVQNDIDHIKKTFFDKLNQIAKQQIDLTKESISSNEELVKIFKPYYDNYQSKLENNQLRADQYDNISDQVLQTERDLTEAEASVKKMKSDLLFYEMPKINSVDVYRSKTYIPESIAISIILGLIFTVALLMLLKYFGDAKRYYKHN